MRKIIVFFLFATSVSGCASQTQREQVISQIEVDGESWIAVKSFDNSSPNDRHYTIRKGEDGTSVIEFGDGEHGARLPTGTRSVRVRYTGVNQQQGRIQLDGLDNCK